VNLERSNQSSNPKWLIKSPISEPANDAIVSYLMDLLVKGKGEANDGKLRTLTTPANQLGQYGLDVPQATIDITLKNQQKHQLILGKRNFNGVFVYARTDTATKPDGNVDVLLVPIDFENAVNRELSEWKQPVDNVKSTPLPSNLPLPTPTNAK